MTTIIYDDTAQTYVAINLPNHQVRKQIQEYQELDNYQVNGTKMDFTQFLIWKDQCDINPNKVTEVAESEIQTIQAD